MSDDELDNFFAKKDKSKKKNKKIKTKQTIQQLQDLDNTENFEEELKKPKKKVKNDEESIEKLLGLNDNDWEQAGDNEIDFTTLRVNNTLVSQKTDEEAAPVQTYMNANSDDDGSDIVELVEETKESGPWKEQHGVAPIKKYEPAPVVVEAPPKIEASGPKRYVPPNQRSGSSMYTSMKSRQPRNVKPNMNSEADFPTLGGAIVDAATGRDGSFMKVKDGAKCDKSTDVVTKVTLENKFNALSN